MNFGIVSHHVAVSRYGRPATMHLRRVSRSAVLVEVAALFFRHSIILSKMTLDRDRVLDEQDVALLAILDTMILWPSPAGRARSRRRRRRRSRRRILVCAGLPAL